MDTTGAQPSSGPNLRNISPKYHHLLLELARTAKPAQDPKQDVVYYIRYRGLIKIGYTAHLRQRMSQHQPDDLLAVEPGDRSVEAARHQRFSDHRVAVGAEREWFEPTTLLLEHIAIVAATYPTPVLVDGRTTRATRAVPAGRPLAGADELAGLACELIAQMGTAEQDEAHALAGLRRGGLSFARISALTGLPTSTVHNKVKRYEVAA